MDDNNNINLIESVKNMSFDQLNDFVSEIRTDLIKYVSKNGGHLASNLGIVELTLALHKVFDTPKDKIIFDVGHQCYVHKMLTGRYDDMEHLRQFNGISGFPKISESVHDMFNSGHSGTSIGVCHGYATARDLLHEDYSCVAVIGDGSLTSGVALEALNLAGASKTPMIVILNDNKMSIGGNVGGISKHLHNLRTSKAYNKFKTTIKSSSNESLQKRLEKIRNALKYSLVPGALFEELGFKYYGPIDGHNIQDLVDALNFAKELKRPVLLHVVTKKGKGFEPAEKNPSKFHGIGSFDPNTVDSISRLNKSSWSEVFGDELCNIASVNDKVVAVSAAMVDATGLRSFKIKYPDKIFDVGIAEQNAVAFSSGMALNGLKPAVAIYSTFLQRAFDQILSEVSLQNLPIVFAIDRAGITGHDGETHQGQFDISYLNLIPNMTILSPRDASTLRKMLNAAFSLNSPVAIRYPRGNVPEKEYLSEAPFSLEPQIVKDGSNVIIFTDGNMFETALNASYSLDKMGISTCVCDLKVLKPLNESILKNIASKFETIVTIEDGTIVGGVGMSIKCILNNQKVLNLGWPDAFIKQGSVEELRHAYGLDVDSVVNRVKDFYETKA